MPIEPNENVKLLGYTIILTAFVLGFWIGSLN